MNTISGILRRATRRVGEPLNVLTCPTHEAFETSLAKTGHTFWAIRTPGIKDWNEAYRPLPSNYVLLNPDKSDQQLPPDIDFDVVLSQQKFGQFQILSKIARKYQLPLVSLEHTQPLPHWPEAQLKHLKSMRGDVNVFISEFSREAWGWDASEAVVIHHGINTDVFKPSDEARKPVILSVVNDWINRDVFCGYKVWREATEGLPTLPIGATPGLSEPAGSVEALAKLYSGSQVFINTSLVSPIPTSLLEAMASGCAVVTTGTSMIPSVIQHGVNGFMSNDPKELNKFCKILLGCEKTRSEFGERARETILTRFSVNAFTNNWNNLLQDL